MESLSNFLSASPILLSNPKTLITTSTPKSHISLKKYVKILNSTSKPNKEASFLKPHQLFFKSQFPFLLQLSQFPLSCFASEIVPTEQVSNRINLESILVSIDNFFTKYPFFVATVTFIWLVVIPLSEEYLQKYKFISAINAYKKLKEEPDAQLLDIRDSKSLVYLGSPNLRILNKNAVQVEFREGDEDAFVKRVLENIGEPANTVVCVVDNFDGNSMKVAELLVKNGYKEAYAIRGGIRGEKGWQAIQESLLPLSVHVYPKKRSENSKKLDTNGGILRENKNNDELSSSTSSTDKHVEEKVNDRDSSSISLNIQSKGAQRPLSPYPNYPDYKPPSSPTPSKPN